MANEFDDITKSGSQDWRELSRQNASQFSPEDYEKTLNLTRQLSAASPRESNRYYGDRAMYRDYTDVAMDSGFGESRFDSRVTNPEDLYNLEEFRAQQQSYIGQLTNGVLKGGVIATTTFADNFIGSVVGTVNLIDEASKGRINSGKDALNAFVQNPFSVLMQDINEKAESWLPNYYTEAEKTTPWYEQFWRANFIGDHFLKNTGFMAGAALSARVSAGLLSKAMQLEKTRDIFRGAALAAGAPEGTIPKQVLNAYKSGDAILEGQKVTEAFAEAAKNLKNAELKLKIAAGVSGSFGESRMEAITNSNDYFNKEKSKFDVERERAIQSIMPSIQHEHPELFQLAYIPTAEGRTAAALVPIDRRAVDDLYNSKLSEINRKYDEVIDELTKERIDYSNTSFGLNLLLTSAENIQLFGDALVGGYSRARVMQDLVKRDAAGRAVASNLGVAKDVMRGIASPFFEGTQEMFQQGVTRGLNAWEGSKLDTFYGKGISEEGLNATNTWLGTMLKGLGNVYASPDEWENFAMGFLTALIPLPTKGAMSVEKGEDGKSVRKREELQLGGEFWESMRAARQTKANASAAAKALNDFADNPEKQSIMYGFVRHQEIDKIQQAAAARGDARTYKDAEYDKFVNAAITFTEAGRGKDFLDMVEAAYTVKKEDIPALREMTTLKNGDVSLFDKMSDDEIVEYFDKQKKQAVENAKQIQDAYQNMEVLYGPSQSKEFKAELVYDIMSTDNREKRIKEITDKVLNLVNTRKNELKDKYGYDVVADLQTIKDLSVFFGDEGQVDELNSLIEQASRGSQKALDTLDKRLTERAKKRNQLSGRVLGLSNVVTRLEAKAADGTITEEEQKKLSSLKRRISRSKADISRIAETIKTLKEEYAMEEGRLNPSEINLPQELNDLVPLLIERESLLARLELLSEHPELFKEGLTQQIFESARQFKDRKVERVYEDFIKTKDLSVLRNAGLTFSDITERAEKDERPEVKAYFKSMEKYADIFESENSQFDLEDEATVAFYAAIQDAIADAKTEEEADALVEATVKDIENSNILGDDTEDLVKAFRRALKSYNKTTEGLKEIGTSPKKKSSKSKESTPEFSSREELEEELEGKSKEELIDLIRDWGIEDNILSQWDDGDGNLIFDGGIEDEDVERDDLATAILEAYDEGAFGEPEENPEGNDDTEDGTDDEEEEANKEEEKEAKKNGVITSESVKGEITPAAPPKKKTSKSVTSAPITKITNTSDKEDGYKLGNSETAPIENEDALSVNRKGAKYDFKPLKDRKERKIVLNSSHWARNILANSKAQEFIDSGELAELKAAAEAEGGKLKVTFVQVRAHPGANIEYTKAEENAIKNNTVFVALELPKGYKDKNGVSWKFYDMDGIPKKMQLLGVVSLPSDASKSMKAMYKKLFKAVQTQTRQAKTSGDRIHPFAYSHITTDVEWIFSGRIVKSTEDIEVGERDLLSIFTDKELKAQKRGEDQLQIVIKTSDFPEDDIVIGNDLGGEVVELNENRPESGGPQGLRNKTDRVGTVWIRTKEADGKVYYKGVKIRLFDENYTDDNSEVAKRIKRVISDMVKGTETQWRNSAIGLQKYLYISSGKKFYIDTKNKAFRIGSESVSFDETDAEEKIYNLIKAQGYRFSLGLSTMSVTQILESKMLYTDLALLHNVNASFLISQVDVTFNDDETSVRRAKAIPSRTVETIIADERIHTGRKGYQEGLDRSHPITFKGNDTVYARYSDGTIWTMVDGNKDTEVVDPYEQALVKLKFLIDLGRIKANEYIPANKALGTKKTLVYRMTDDEGNDIVMTQDGIVLTDAQRADLRAVKTKAKGKKSALRRLQEVAAGSAPATKLKEDYIPDVLDDLSTEELREIAEGEVPEELKENLGNRDISEFKVGDSYTFYNDDYSEEEELSITSIDDEKNEIYFSDDSSMSIEDFLEIDTINRLVSGAKRKLKSIKEAKEEKEEPVTPPTVRRSARLPGGKQIVILPKKISDDMGEISTAFVEKVRKDGVLKKSFVTLAKRLNKKSFQEFQEYFAKLPLSKAARTQLAEWLSSDAPEDTKKAFDYVEKNIDCW